MLDTHDGVGVQGVKGILTREQVETMIERAKEHGAYVSYKPTKPGEEPYEINTTWWSAINMDGSTEPIALQVKRYVASRSIALVLKGIPGIYTHGAIALPNDHALVEKTGVKRDVNRGRHRHRDLPRASAPARLQALAAAPGAARDLARRGHATAPSIRAARCTC